MPVENPEKDGEPPKTTETALNDSVAQEKESGKSSKADASGNSSLDNMESLLMEEDENENEDPFGTESLRMSGSESEGDEKVSPGNRKKRAEKVLEKIKSPTKSASKVLKNIDEKERREAEKEASSLTQSESQVVDRNKGDEERGAENELKLSINQSGSQIPDNDEHDEERGAEKDPKFSLYASKIVDKDEDGEEREVEEEEKVSPVSQRRRVTQIMDSDDEDRIAKEPSDNARSELSKPKKFSALIDSESEEEIAEPQARISNPIDSDSEVEVASKKKKKKHHKKSMEAGKSSKQAGKSSKKGEKPSKAANSDSGNESEPSTSKKVSDLIDSDSESSLPSDEEIQNEVHEDDATPAEKPKKKQRASAKKAIDEIQAIQSETQRLYRETQVSIPYHKPKRHTLKEFLTRRTIMKPQVAQGGSGKKLRMTPEELEAYAKQLEERANEAEEFFKSESEDEMKDVAEDEEKAEEPVGEVPEGDLVKPQEDPANASEDPAKPPEDPEVMDTDEIDTIVDAGVLSTQDLMDIEMSQEIGSEQEPQTEDRPKSTAPVTSLSELKRRLVAEKHLPSKPTLKGDPNMIIDFETGDLISPKPTGLESLFQRFVKCNAVHKKKPKEGLSAMSLECSPLEVSKIAVSIIEEPNKEKEPKPGASYVKLKENLRTLITKKRREDMEKKKEETKEEEEEYNKCCGLDEDDEEEEEKEREKERERRFKKLEKEIMIDDEENEIELLEDDEEEGEKEDDGADEIDNEGAADDNDGDAEADEGLDQVENEEEDEDDDDDSDDDDEEEEPENPSTKKHRVIKAFEDSDDEKDEVDATGLNTTSTSVLFAEEEKKNPEEVEDELLDLCSGQFDESQRAPLISQIPITQTAAVVDDTELMNLCSGVFNEASKTQLEPLPESQPKTVTKILSSDEEKEPQEEEPANDTKKIKKLKKKMKKKRAKLGFSDDEDEEEDEQLEAQESYDEEEIEEEIPETYIDYDSEENEIEVQMTKKEAVKQANAFVENEAELSESEWGSADEDEKNMDKYDIELGDEDEFDRDKIRTELEQIHMRKVLDDDIREVKKIQELLFDNEEADGVGRERKFRWKNLETGFALDNPAGGDGDNDENVDSCDDEEEMQWRKMRFEREQLLQQKTKEEILAEVSATSLGKALLSTMEPDIKQKVEITKEVLVAKEYKKPSFLILQNDVKSMSGSFLNYDKETLARIAETVSKSGLPDDNEQLQQKASKRGNFVFAPLSEEEQAIRKRKAEELQNAKSGNLAKKSKPNISKKPLLLDKLL